MPRILRIHAFTPVAGLLALLTILPFVLPIGAIRCRVWDAATTYATLLAGVVAADVPFGKSLFRTPVPSWYETFGTCSDAERGGGIWP
jgi:hypothetical protein